MRQLPIIIRDLEARDLNFCIKSWLRTHRSAAATRGVPSEIFYDAHKAKILASIRNGAEIIIAANAEEPDQILGFCCFLPRVIDQRLVLHYIYVKSMYRKLGIGHGLIAEAVDRCDHDGEKPIIATHLSRDFWGFMPDITYNPYLF